MILVVYILCLWSVMIVLIDKFNLGFKLERFSKKIHKVKPLSWFLYELSSCYFCMSFWSGVILYLVFTQIEFMPFNWYLLFIIPFAGAGVNVLFYSNANRR